MGSGWSAECSKGFFCKCQVEPKLCRSLFKIKGTLLQPLQVVHASSKAYILMMSKASLTIALQLCHNLDMFKLITVVDLGSQRPAQTTKEQRLSGAVNDKSRFD